MAAAVVLAVGGQWAAADLSGRPGGPGDGVRVQRWVGADRGSGAAAVVTAARHEWGTAVALEAVRVPTRRSVRADRGGPGRQRGDGDQLVGRGPGGGLVEVDGGAALRPEAIDRFEVRTAGGRRLVTVTR